MTILGQSIQTSVDSMVGRRAPQRTNESEAEVRSRSEASERGAEEAPGVTDGDERGVESGENARRIEGESKIQYLSPYWAHQALWRSN